MPEIILESLVRQAKGSELLNSLLMEEYALLRQSQPDEVAGLEISVQELIRQLVREREFMLRRLELAGLAALSAFRQILNAENQDILDTWQARIIAFEQESARQASINAELALALWRQSGELLDHLHRRVAPQERTTYTARGTWYSRPTTAAFIRGRL